MGGVDLWQHFRDLATGLRRKNWRNRQILVFRTPGVLWCDALLKVIDPINSYLQ